MQPRRDALLALPALLLAACATAPKNDHPPIPPNVDRAHLHFSDTAIREGGPAPDFELPVVSGPGEGGR